MMDVPPRSGSIGEGQGTREEPKGRACSGRHSVSFVREPQGKRARTGQNGPEQEETQREVCMPQVDKVKTPRKESKQGQRSTSKTAAQAGVDGSHESTIVGKRTREHEGQGSEREGG